MFTVELYAKVRHAVLIEGVSRREAAKRFGIHRNTITKMLSFSVPPGYRRRERPTSKKLGPYLAWIDAIFEGDSPVHKKQRHTAHRRLTRPAHSSCPYPGDEWRKLPPRHQQEGAAATGPGAKPKHQNTK